ncbi:MULTISPECIES: helix-turn-helix domain-containing protein [unclassified Beijerinckia]|uniref:IclR family transcriptional regulator n=1 Tax=unclassified Beijerinckia TaxID=2638183 RepID=UPI00089B7D44|nr:MULTISPECIES: helix-turn-helix domain-containing protein [unclassified Beijerinckia]MDH7797817.1 IclR family mhp operon transcriptional activator [Beijerinckia sp. GAS462]SEC99541.1 transcriptional regulator, IclR family [Beijerinckia sp. 28-YEA-48]
MEALPQIRAVHRALDVLEFLAANGPSELHRLHKGTGLSKSTLRRLLATLMERRFIRLGLSDGLYRSNIAASDSSHAEMVVRIGELVEAAKPHMLALTRETEWPVDLHIYATGRMRILESTYGQSPFPSSNMLKPDTELSVFAAATGLAYLAALSEKQLIALIDTLKGEKSASLERFGLTAPLLINDLINIRSAGFATRRQSRTGLGDRNAIAVALYDGRQPIGALAISWKRQLMNASAFAALHLDRLKQAAGAISASLSGEDEAGRPAPDVYAWDYS